MEKITVSLIKADIGGFPGHSTVHHKLIDTAKEQMQQAMEDGLLVDYHVLNAGDDLQLLMSHRKGVDAEEIHGLAWKTFEAATEVAKELKLHGAGQDLLGDAFSGNIRGMGPGIAELEFVERGSEPLVAYMMDKTEPGAFNYPIYKIFADPFNTAGLVVDPTMHAGYVFEVWDIKDKKKVFFRCPEELYSLLALIGAKSKYIIKRVFPKDTSPVPAEEAVAVISTEKLFFTAGKYVGKDDPVALVRSQSGLPALGEILEPFSMPYLVSGWMRGSHNGPIMPVSFADSQCTRFDGPPRVIAAGFQVSNGRLVGPADLFDDPSYDFARSKALEIADYMRAHGPFEPHRLPLEEMEYTTLPDILKKLEDRFEDTD
ncbi:MAG: fructose 1,6-bisphosphatase [Methanophagales archaeon]|nr:fructose 1,6-bisphosphatase [Methanophagales archaeon]